MTNRMEAEPDALTREMFSRRVPSRNGKHQGNGKPKTTTRFAELNPFVDEHIAKLKPSEAIVWLVIWRHVNKETKLATIAHNTIATKAGLKRRAAIKAAKDLEAKGYLTVTARGGPTGTSNTYRPTIPS